MNIFFWELKSNRKAFLIWCACMVLGVWSGMAKYTAYSSDPNAGDVFADMPASMKALFGMKSFAVTQMSGYFAMLIGYVALALAIHAALLGACIIAKEERDKRTEFLMMKPVSRRTVVTAKLAAGLLNVVALSVVTLISALLMTASYNKGADVTEEVVLFCVTVLFIQLIFFTLGAALSAAMKNPKHAGSLATGILFAAFVLAKITDLTDKLAALKVLTPFQYFNAETLAAGGGLNGLILVLSALLSGAFVCACYFCYLKRDLNH
ncbi:MAG: ABC transporter permease subunit [Oscillospiraceae bacterium]